MRGRTAKPVEDTRSHGICQAGSRLTSRRRDRSSRRSPSVGANAATISSPPAASAVWPSRRRLSARAACQRWHRSPGSCRRPSHAIAASLPANGEAAEDISGEKAGESEKTRRRSAELGPHGAQTALQEALLDFAGRQGHRGVKFSGRVACAAEPAQVVRQGSVPQMGVLQAGDGLQGSQPRLAATVSAKSPDPRPVPSRGDAPHLRKPWSTACASEPRATQSATHGR